MKRPTLTIGALLQLVLLIGIGLAALRNPTRFGAMALGTLLQGFLVIAILAAVLRRGSQRAFWIGFVICGGGYTLLAFEFSGSPEIARPPLLTRDLLILLHHYITETPANPSSTFARMTTVSRTDWRLFLQTGQIILGLLAAVSGGILGRFLADDAPQGRSPET